VDAAARGAVALLNSTGQHWVWLEGDARFVVPRQKCGVIAGISAHVHRESARITEKPQEMQLEIAPHPSASRPDAPRKRSPQQRGKML
jgi:hypothetical protein